MVLHNTDAVQADLNFLGFVNSFGWNGEKKRQKETLE